MTAKTLSERTWSVSIGLINHSFGLHSTITIGIIAAETEKLWPVAVVAPIVQG